VERHGRGHELAGVHRKTRYGPLFAKPIGGGDKGVQRELTKRILEARGRLRGGRPRKTACGGASVKFGEKLSVIERDKKVMESTGGSEISIRSSRSGLWRVFEHQERGQR
jgi:hypothetical protein